MNTEFNIPENWKVVTFEDVSEGKNAIVDGPFGSNLKTSDYIEDKVNGVPVLTTKNLEGDYSDDKVRFISKDKFETLKRSQVDPGDILVAKIGSIGKTGIYPKNARTAIIPANLLKFTVSKNVNFNYVFYYLNSRGLQNRIKKIATATAQPAFNVTKFRKLRIPLPPLPEQHRIVSKIEELFSELDKGIESLKTARQQLKVYRQAVLKWAFEGRLTNEENEISIVPFGLIIKVVSGNTPKGLEYVSNKGEIQFYKVSDMNLEGNEVEMRTTKLHLTKSEIEKLKIKLYPKGTVIFPKRGGAILTNKKRILASESSFDLNLMGALPNEKVDGKYLFYWFQKLDLGKIYDGSNVPQINNKNIEPLDFPICKIEEQKQIVSEIETRLSVCDKLEETMTTALQQSEALRQSILKKAFEGKLVAQDPNDEPAAKLLEKIKAESAKAR